MNRQNLARTIKRGRDRIRRAMSERRLVRSQGGNRSGDSLRSNGSNTPRSNTAATPRPTSQVVPEHWKVVTEETEAGKFKEILRSVKGKHEGGKLTYRPQRPGDKTGPEIRMDHPDPGRAIHWVAESHQDLNHGIRHIHKEVNYKIAREDDERFKELYQKLRNPSFNDDYLSLHDVTSEELKDESARILYKQDIDGKYAVRVSHRNPSRCWTVKEDSLKKAIESMDKHLDEFETNSTSTSWTRDNAVWNEIYELMEGHFAKAKVFRKTVEEESGRKWIFRVSREEETKIYKAKADHRNDAAKKLRDWLNNNRHIYKHKTVLHSTPRLHSRPVSFDWAEIKRSDQEDGAFAKIFKDVKRLRLRGTLFYMADNVRSGQHLKWVSEDSSEPTIVVHKHKRDLAVKELRERLQEKEVDVNSNNDYRSLAEWFNRVNAKYPRHHRRNALNAKVFCLSKPIGFRRHTYRIRLQHDFWGFTKTGGTVKKAAEALADHLTNYLPVNRETFEELFGREYDNGGEYWEKLRKAKTYYVESKLFCRRDGSKYIIKLDDEAEGELFKSGMKESEREAVLALADEIKQSRGTKGSKHILHGKLEDDLTIDFSEIEVKKGETETGKFDDLLSDIAKHYNDAAKAYYSRVNGIITITIKLFEGNEARTVFKVSSSGLQNVITKCKFLFNFEEVPNSEESYKLIRQRVQDHPQHNNGDSFKILRKQDLDKVYVDPVCWFIRVEHPIIGFQVHDEKEANAIKRMEEHLAYTKVTKENLPSEDSQWVSILNILGRSYGLCQVFIRTSPDGKYTAKVDHPNFGRQHTIRDVGGMRELARELLSYLLTEEANAKKEFIFDPVDVSISKQRRRSTEEDRRYKVAQKRDENQVFRDLFKVAHQNHGKENIRVLYCLKPQGIKVEYRGQFYFKIEHNSEKLEDLVPKAIRFMQFKEIPQTDKVCKDLHDKLGRRNFSLQPRLYMKVMKKNKEVKLDIKANRKRKDNEGRKYRRPHAIKVDHAEIGFTAYGKDTEHAKRSMLDHLDYKELTKRNHRSISALGGQDNQKLLEQIFAIIEEGYGWCRLFHKTKGGMHFLKVDHELKGPQYLVEKPSVKEALETLKELLEDDKEARKHDFAFEIHVNKDPIDACMIWKPIQERRGTTRD